MASQQLHKLNQVIRKRRQLPQQVVQKERQMQLKKKAARLQRYVELVINDMVGKGGNLVAEPFFHLLNFGILKKDCIN